jgi:oligopeptidase B
LTTMLDDKLPLTVNEYDEWGNPNDIAYYHYIKSYSPYDNVRPAEYPALLVTAGLNDPRVSYWEPAKWVARLRTLASNGHPIVLKTQMGSGHSGPSGRYESWREEAFVMAFVIEQLGLDLATGAG